MRGLRTFLGLVLAFSFGAARAEFTPAQACAAGKEKTAGRALAATLACRIRAAATGKPLKPLCVRKPARKLAATFNRFGAACPGAAASVATLIDDVCVDRLLRDLTGTGECPITAARAVGRAARGGMVCAAKALAKTGSFDRCTTREKARLDGALSAAWRCVANGTADDLETDCIAPLLNALPPTIECGTFLTTWETPADGSLPTGIAADRTGNVYVAVDGNSGVSSGVRKFDGTGTLLTTWGSSGSGPGQFVQTNGVAVDVTGNVFVADRGNGRIQKFDGSGAFLTAWSVAASAVAIGHGDHVYAFELSCPALGTACEGTIDEFDGNGTPLASFAAGAFPRDQRPVFTVDGSGNVYLSDCLGSVIRKFDRTGSLLASWGRQGSEPGQLFCPAGIAVDARGHVFVADTGNDRIQEFDSTGTFLTAWGIVPATDRPNDLGYPPDVAVDGAGHVYVSDDVADRIWKFGCP